MPRKPDHYLVRESPLSKWIIVNGVSPQVAVNSEIECGVENGVLLIRRHFEKVLPDGSVLSGIQTATASKKHWGTICFEIHGDGDRLKITGRKNKH